MGQICFHSGLSKRLYAAVAAWTGHRRGGVGAATFMACGGFSAICGSNTATAATMSSVALPEMRKYGYHPVLASGTVAAGTTLGAVIPPSVVAIVLGVQTRLSIRQLFMGGIAPGLLLLGLFTLSLYVVIMRRPGLAPAGERVDMRERLHSLPGLIEALVLFGLVVGGLSAGFFTPSEAGAAGSALALVLGLVRKSLPLKRLGLALVETMQIAAMIFLLLAGAAAYGKFLVISEVPFMAASLVSDLGLGAHSVLILIFIVYLIGGMVMDALALLLITIPIFYPLIADMGIDPVWFCLMLLVVTTMGAITPPVGASAYVVAGMGRLTLGTVFKGSLYFIPAFIACLAIMLAFPDLVLFLPNLVK
jgi:tripartite ATP-independent transporter DctM subunit